MKEWKKWIIRTAIVTLIAGAGYAGARDRLLTKTVEKVDQLENKETTASAERKEIVQAQNKTNDRLSKTNQRLSGIEAKLETLLKLRGVIVNP